MPRYSQSIFSLLLAGIAAIFIVFAVPASAQTDASTQNKGAENASRHTNWNAILGSAEQAVSRDGIDQEELERITVEAQRIESDARKLIDEKTPVRDRVRTQLDELGPAPEKGQQPESPELSAQRKSLEDEFADVDGEIKDARLAIVRTQQLKATIIQERRNRFIESISTRVIGFYTPDFWARFASGFDGLGRSFYLMMKDSISVAAARIGDAPHKVLFALIALLVGGLGYRFSKQQVNKIVAYTQAAGLEAQPQKSTRAAVEFITSGLLNAAAVYGLFFVVSALNLFTPKLERFFWQVAVAIIILILARSLGKIFLGSGREDDRIAGISTETAAGVYKNCRNALFAVAVLHVLNDTAVMLVTPFEVSVGLSAILTIVVCFSLIQSLLRIGRERVGSGTAKSMIGGFLSWMTVKPLLWIAAIIAIVSLLLTYVSFAEYLSLQIIVGLILIGLLWIALDFVEALKQALIGDEQKTQQLSLAIGFQPGRIKQFSVLGFGLTKTLIMILVAMAMLLPWGFRTSEWVDWVNEAFFGFQVGGLTISMSTIFMVLVLFIIGYAVTRAIQGWLSNQFLPTTSIDSGLRNSISTILGYIGIVIAAMLAVSAAGVDLSNLAIVAGALSVGVGFGLQSIVNNFVSGLILLAERPIKSGDWIVTSGGEGTVRKISVRSTEIETFERATIIVPNSTLITESVANWTHTSKFGRVNIVIGVGYDSDPDQVKQILLDCFSEHDGILKNPAPSVFLTDFGADALIFDARGFLSNIENGFGTKSDIRFAILQALRENNIEIPFPQRDVNLRADWDEVGRALAATPKPSRRRTSKSGAAE